MEKEKVKIFNSSKNELPDYGSEKSAGFDIRSDFSRIISESDFIGNDKYVFKNDDDNKILLLKPNGRILIPTGLRVAIPDGYELQIRPRSGLALKHGISVLNSPGTIDCFSEKSMIKTINGDKFIHELKINDIVLSVNNDTLEIEKDEISAIINTGKQNILIIETDDGVLEITPNTDVYTDNGLKKAHELKENDNILYYE